MDNSVLLTSFDSNRKQNCLASCNKYLECIFAVFRQNKCFICKKNLTLFMSSKADGGDSLTYQKQFKKSVGLINYWSFNSNVNDSIQNANLFGGVNAILTYDRFGVSGSALSLSTGYYKVPPGVYFSGTQFSFMAWVKVKTFTACMRLIDFGNGSNNENFVYGLSTSSNNRKPYVYFSTGADIFTGFSQTVLNLNQWQHLACVYTFPFYSIYFDGIERTLPGSKTSYSTFSMENGTRTSNYIGRSNWMGDISSVMERQAFQF